MSVSSHHGFLWLPFSCFACAEFERLLKRFPRHGNKRIDERRLLVVQAIFHALRDHYLLVT